MRRAGIAATLLLWLGGVAAAAPSPFGVGLADAPPGMSWAGPFAPALGWIAAQQAVFYRQLTDALDAVNHDARAIWILFGISFAYGVFHAAGPGHGKAVITSYLLATRDTLRRGVFLAFASAMVQATVAVVLVAIAAGLLHVTAMTMTNASVWLELGSYAMIAAVGAWLLWRKTFGAGHQHHHHAPVAVPALMPAVAGGPAGSAALLVHDEHDLADHRGHHHDHGHADGHDHHHHDHAHGEDCDCGHAHIPDPASLREPLDLRRAMAAILAVGIRPCSGAIIVLVFALSVGVFPAGIASTYVMGLGTGLAVAVLAVLAVTAKGVALRLAGAEEGRAAVAIHGLEILAAAGVLIFGLLLLAGSLASNPFS